MKLNEDKFEYLHYTIKDTEHHDYTVCDATQYIEVAEKVKDLGVLFSPSLNWKDHLHKITDTARSMMAWALSVFYSRETLPMLTIYKSLIRCHLEYCCPLWHSNNRGDISEIESVQRTFTAKIQSVKHLTYWERLAKLDLMSLQRRREILTILYVENT